LDLIDAIAAKSSVLSPGIDLARLDEPVSQSAARNPHLPSPIPHSSIILWNSRWEYDKGPEAFFAALHALEERGVDFRVIVAGEPVDPNEPNFQAARAWLAPRTLAWGYAPDQASYSAMLHQADLVVSSAIQEFFGISVIEAMYCGCVPILPRRLSYPDLLPPEHHAACLYDGDAGLVDKLEAAIGELAALKLRDFRGVAAQYDWSRMAPRWDAAVEQLRGSRVDDKAQPPSTGSEPDFGKLKNRD
jgi:glycosyltransferase involved in cell wall biosynthesis